MAFEFNLPYDYDDIADYHHNWSPFDHHRLEHHIENDDKQEFVQLLKSQFAAAIKDCGNNEIFLSNYLLTYIIISDAINCATALLKGDTGLTLDLNDPQLWSLHGAAEFLSPKMTKFFLKSGVPATARISNPETDDDGLLPIDYAVCSVGRKMVLWTKEEPLYSLIVELTGEGMIGATETIRLLINEMSEADVSEIICRYAAEGKIIELAALLILCSERSIKLENLYMPTDFVSPGNRMTLRQYVVNMIVLLENEVRKLVDVDSNKLVEYREMKESMMSILMLLEIFLRTDKEIARVARLSNHSYPETHQAIAHVFESSGFKVNGRDLSHLEWIIPERSQRHLDNFHHRLKFCFSSEIPQLGLLGTMLDSGWDDTDHNHRKLLSVQMALKELLFVTKDIYWTSKGSIFKLIILLCLPRMKDILDAASLFAEKSEKISEIACFCAKEGKLIELTIILMVAGQKVMDPIMCPINGGKSKGSMTFQQFINSELAQAIDLECRLIGRVTEQEKKLSNIFRKRKLAMLSALTLLEIFEKAGPRLQCYIRSKRDTVQKEQVIKDVSKLLSKAGFKLTSKDTEIIDTVESSFKASFELRDETIEDPNINSSALQHVNEIAEMCTSSGSRKQDVRRLSYSLPCGFVESDAACGRPYDIRKFLLTRYPWECKPLPSTAESFRAFWTSDAVSRHFAEFPKALKVQRGHAIAVNKFMPKLPINKKFCTVAFAIKRRVKYP